MKPGKFAAGRAPEPDVAVAGLGPRGPDAERDERARRPRPGRRAGPTPRRRPHRGCGGRRRAPRAPRRDRPPRRAPRRARSPARCCAPHGSTSTRSFARPGRAAHGAACSRAADEPHVARRREAPRARHGLGEQRGAPAGREQRLRARLARERPEAGAGSARQDHRDETRCLHRPTLWYSKPAFAIGPGS